MLNSNLVPGIDEIRLARETIAPWIHRTPIFTSSSLNSIAEAEIFFKCENFQKTGSFKIRGAINALNQLKAKQMTKAVATHSSGNHGAALAYAAAIWQLKAYIVMPCNAPQVKKAAVQSYGGEIIECEPTLKARLAQLNQIVEDYRARFIPPYNDPSIIAGQGTAAMELLAEIDRLDYILAPVGGGGLLSGTAIATANCASKTKIIGVEPAGADDTYQSFQAGYIIPCQNPSSLADGLLTCVGSIPFAIIQKYVSEIVTVSENKIQEGMGLIWERMKLIVEPSGAVALAAILAERNKFVGKRIGVILSGGNLDFTRFSWY